MASPARIICLLLCLGPVLAGSDEAPRDEPAGEAEAVIEDIENVPTPTTLAGLLPEGGIDAVEVDYWLTMTMRSADGRAVANTASYYHWSVKPEDGRLVFEYRYGNAGINARHTRKRTAYSAKGELIEYVETMDFINGRSHTTNGKIVEGELVLTTVVTAADGTPQGTAKTRKVPIDNEADALPLEWLPLVTAYHVRTASLGYTYHTIDVSRNNQLATNRVADLGVEQFDADGKTRRAHLLRVERTYDNHRGGGPILKMLVGETGEVLLMDSVSGKYELSYRRATRASVVEQFGDLPE